jgi:hypothetical protein
MAQLEVLHGKKRQRLIDLDVPRLIVGRGAEAHVVLEHPVISRLHCEIVTQHGIHYMRDLASATGLFKGEDEVGVVRLDDQDEMELGPFTLRYHSLPGKKAPTADEKPHWAALGEQKKSYEEEKAESAAAMIGTNLPDLKEEFKATMMAQPGEIRRIRQRLQVKQGAHLKVKFGRKVRLVALDELPFVVGHDQTCDLRLPTTRLLGKRCFAIVRAGDRIGITPMSWWAGVKLGGARVLGTTILSDGDGIETRGIRLRFCAGEAE